MSSVATGANAASSTTRWSIVAHALSGAALSPRDALGELCVGYWYPVYAYVRRAGHAPAIACDISRAFLAHLLHGFRNAAHPLPNAQFRPFLLEQLNTFLGGDWRDAHDESDSELILPADDVEARYERECRNTPSPERAFQRGFAFEVLGRALRCLATEAEQTGHAAMFHALTPFLVRDPTSAQCEELARRLHAHALTLAMAIKRLRQRLRELVGEELADTVASADELEGERDALYAALLEDGGPA